MDSNGPLRLYLALVVEGEGVGTVLPAVLASSHHKGAVTIHCNVQTCW
jgi:hypothetical protein